MRHGTILTTVTEPEIMLQTTLYTAHLVYILSLTDGNTPLSYVRLQRDVLTTSSVEFPQLVHSLKIWICSYGSYICNFYVMFRLLNNAFKSRITLRPMRNYMFVR
jgi:hypothetical protein